jgi:alkylhydroperoxidase/carboxymuconolactone decarboxylase family protein YurZ
MSKSPEPPKRYQEFVQRYPALGQAWELIAKAGREGPLDERTARLIKFAVAVGAQQEGSAHASVRKALALGIGRDELEQVVALAAGTIGLPRVVTAHCWLNDEFAEKPCCAPAEKPPERPRKKS